MNLLSCAKLFNSSHFIYQLHQSLINSPHADKIPALLAEAHQLLGGEEVKRLSWVLVKHLEIILPQQIPRIYLLAEKH